jgi:hypothetical protein
MRIIFSFLLIATSLLTNAQNSDKGLLYLNKPLSSDAINQVDAKTSGGGIQVTGVSPSEARIEVYVNGNGRHNNYTKAEVDKIMAEDYDF